MLLILLSAETEWLGWPSLHSCHINIDMCTYSFYMFVLYTSIPRWCFSIDCHPDSSRFSQLDPLAACKEFQKIHQTKTTREKKTVQSEFHDTIALKKVVCFSKAKGANFSPGNTRGFLSAKYLPALPKLPPQLKKQHSWVVAGRFEPVKTLRFSNFAGTSLPSVEECMFVWGELWKMIVRLLLHLSFNDVSIHSYMFPSLFLRPLLIMKPWRSEGFSMSPRLLQGYVLKTRLLNENPTALSWEMVWVRGTRAGHSEFRR